METTLNKKVQQVIDDHKSEPRIERIDLKQMLSVSLDPKLLRELIEREPNAYRNFQQRR